MPHQSPTTIFDRIISGEVPCNKVYEDEFCLAFHDLHPQAPVHVLVIPKTRITNVMSASASDSATLGAVLLGAANAARSLGLDSTGYRLVFNNGPDGGQSVDYLHCHILGGRPMGWPPG